MPFWKGTADLASVEGEAWFWPLPPAVPTSAGAKTAGGAASVEGAAWLWPLAPAVAALSSVVPPVAEVVLAANAPVAGAMSRTAAAASKIARIVLLLEIVTPARPDGRAIDGVTAAIPAN